VVPPSESNYCIKQIIQIFFRLFDNLIAIFFQMKNRWPHAVCTQSFKFRPFGGPEKSDSSQKITLLISYPPSHCFDDILNWADWLISSIQYIIIILFYTFLLQKYRKVNTPSKQRRSSSELTGRTATGKLSYCAAPNTANANDLSVLSRNSNTCNIQQIPTFAYSTPFTDLMFQL